MDSINDQSDQNKHVCCLSIVLCCLLFYSHQNFVQCATTSERGPYFLLALGTRYLCALCYQSKSESNFLFLWLISRDKFLLSSPDLLHFCFLARLYGSLTSILLNWSALNCWLDVISMALKPFCDFHVADGPWQDVSFSLPPNVLRLKHTNQHCHLSLQQVHP